MSRWVDRPKLQVSLTGEVLGESNWGHVQSIRLQEHGPRPAEFPQSLTKKDANAFLRAVRQRGVVKKLDLVCQGGFWCMPVNDMKTPVVVGHAVTVWLALYCCKPA